MKYIRNIMLLLSLLVPSSIYAEFEWVSCTLDNDLFVGEDSGYTNGLYIALYDIKNNDVNPSPSWMLKPLLWSLPKGKILESIHSYTIGQTIMTPEDISLEEPGPNDMPYAGLLTLNNTFLSINENYADKISTIIGILGPLSGAEQTQKSIHKMIGATEPKGWDSQLENEIVIEFSRARAYRTWKSDFENWDIISTGEIRLGTLSSSINAGAMLRFGKNLEHSYASVLYASTRTMNPISIGAENWNIYIGLTAEYTFNQIFTNGNTFQDSSTLDYKHEKIRSTLGISYSWKSYAFSFAINDLNIMNNKQETKQLDKYGTLSLAIKL